MIKNKYIVFIIILGSAVLIGLASIQFYWMENAYQLKEAEFEQNVKKSLFDVRKKIAKKEAMKRFSRTPYGNQWMQRMHSYQQEQSFLPTL